MAKEFNVAVAGATGAVGVEMIKTLEKRNFPVKNLKLLASARSAGKTLEYKGEKIVIEEMKYDSFKGVDIALFSAGGSISKEYRKYVVDSGAVMIDNSSAFRMDDDVPLVVPEVNAEDVKNIRASSPIPTAPLRSCWSLLLRCTVPKNCAVWSPPPIRLLPAPVPKVWLN